MTPLPVVVKPKARQIIQQQGLLGQFSFSLQIIQQQGLLGQFSFTLSSLMI